MSKFNVFKYCKLLAYAGYLMCAFVVIIATLPTYEIYKFYLL